MPLGEVEPHPVRSRRQRDAIAGKEVLGICEYWIDEVTLGLVKRASSTPSWRAFKRKR